MPLTPDEEIDNKKIIAQNLHRRKDEVLSEMLPAHEDKIPIVQSDLSEVLDADGIRGRVWDFKQAGLSVSEANQAAQDEREFYQDKIDRLGEIVRLIKVEQGFRADGKVDRKGDIVP